MSRPVAVVRHREASLVPVRLGVRWKEGDSAFFGEARLAVGRMAVGPWRLTVAADVDGEIASYEVDVAHDADSPLQLDALVLGFRWEGIDAGHVRFLRHGWQSWSTSEGRVLDARGEEPFPSGPWLRGIWHALGEPPADRAGWHESDLVTALGAGAAACSAGVLERGRGFGVAFLRPESDGVRVEVEVCLEAPVAPGETQHSETVRVALGDDPQALLEQHADAHGRASEARVGSRFRAGWCTWYHFFHDVGEADVLRNLDALSAARDEIPVAVVQIDDGYQRAIGDWRETNANFPRGIAPLAAEIRTAGFEAGLWTAPFCVVRESALFDAHPEWLLRDDDGLFRGLLHPVWTPDAAVYVLDASLDPVCDHLESLFRELVDMGFTYQKLDFLYSEAMHCVAADPSVTRAARLRRGLEAVRRGCGPEAFLLGCGCPLGPAVGIVDGMRIGPDVAPSWGSNAPVTIPGLGPTEPSTYNAVRNVLNRMWMHRRLWQNDPDCVMARSEDTALSADEAGTLAAAVAVSGGMAIFSDDLPELSAESRALVGDTLRLARRVDAASPLHGARATDLLAQAIPTGVRASTLAADVEAAFNTADEPHDGLAAHASRIQVENAATPRGLAVFCDMDGTYIDKDVGATLAQQYAGERRPAAWARFERGELTAWEYNEEILEGLPVSEDALDAFLRTVSLDPGAAALQEWCAKRDVAFTVLSDGFDLNLDRLQELLGVRFDYDANHLHYEDNVWRIEPGFPNPACDCGTGTCKAGRMAAWRASHPNDVIVHVGNGRVSDLCGALAADLAFAKDSLAVELARRGERFEPFDTLYDVVAGLEGLWGRD